MGPSGLCDTDVATFYSLILFSWLSLRSFENSITLERSVSLAVSGGGLILPLCAIANIVTWCQHVAQVFLSIILCVYCNTASEYDLIQQNSRSMSPAYAFASCICICKQLLQWIFFFFFLPPQPNCPGKLQKIWCQSVLRDAHWNSSTEGMVCYHLAVNRHQIKQLTEYWRKASISVLKWSSVTSQIQL